MFKPVNIAEFVGGSVIKEGDTANTLQVRLMDGDGVPKDLSAATVTWSLSSYVGRLTDDRPATILTNGVVEIGFNSTDAIGFGSLLLQFNVTLGGTVEKFPADAQLVIRVTRSHENLIHSPVTFASLSVVEARMQSQYDAFVGSVVEGSPGVGLTYTWSGTQLGIKREDEVSYTFVNLKGATGDVGPPGIQGLPGEKGDPGTGIEIKGSLDNTGQLPSTGNVISDAYLIGGVLYIWEGAAWDNAGTIQGPQGIQGDPGIQGVPGKNFEYLWNGYQLGVRQQGEVEYSFVNLRGATGPTGNTGLTGATGSDGIDGKNIEFLWNGTQLGIRQQGDPTYVYQDLKGATGDTGLTGTAGTDGADGNSLEFIWSGTELGVRVAGTTIYSYVNLKGDKGDIGNTGLTGDVGPPGAAGKDLEFVWNGYTLGVRQQGATTYTYSQSLRGATGATGDTGLTGAPGTNGVDGKDLEFLWNGYTLGVRKVGDALYTYSVSLRGEQGIQGIQGQTGAPGADGADANLFIEQRTTDPASPVPGQVWMRTDL